MNQMGTTAPRRYSSQSHRATCRWGCTPATAAIGTRVFALCARRSWVRLADTEDGSSLLSVGRPAAAAPLPAARASNSRWRYESSVGASLPILSTMKDLLLTGDRVHSIRGCLSGTMAYVLRCHAPGRKTFCDALREAIANGYTETDVREDLSGEDMARKVVILARELGMDNHVPTSARPEALRSRAYTQDLHPQICQITPHC